MSKRKTVMRSAVVMSLCLCLGLTGLNSTVYAGTDRLYSGRLYDRDEVRDYKNDASSAAAQAQARYGGKVLNVTKSTSNGRTVYRVKLLLDSGRIKIVTIAE